MASVLEQTTFTTEQLLAMPDDGMERWLIDGELREKPVDCELQGSPMTVRNRFHSRILITVAFFLEDWNRRQPKPRGQFVGGDAGFRLTRDPDSTVGVDVAYAPPAMASQEIEGTTIFEGAPLLAVEILSPNDTQQDIHEKVRKYHGAGTKLVWIIDPEYPTVTVYESGKMPALYNREQQVSGDPYLPGLVLPVAELLE